MRVRFEGVRRHGLLRKVGVGRRAARRAGGSVLRIAVWCRRVDVEENTDVAWTRDEDRV